MSLAIIYSRASRGIEAPLVTIEVHISNGIPSLSIVGLPETAIKESKDRVRSAIINSHFTFPTRRITINLAPADLPKREGGRFDLPIALGILAASQQIAATNFAQYEFAGELALDGCLRGFNGALPFVLETKKAKRKLVIPTANGDEATLPQDVVVLAADHLLAVCAHLDGQKTLEPYVPTMPRNCSPIYLDLSDIRGQNQAKRALEIAAAGQHSLLMSGPPGSGKTMLASRLSGILPEMSDAEALEIAAINSICGKMINPQSWRTRPFRAPHHTASSAALVGGSSPPRPGEISLAHNGVLFLDELPEFNRAVLEALREPVESGSVSISRASHQAKFPAKFQLVTAMNPCPCGYLGDPAQNCRCTQEQIQRYQTRISGPMLDRIDMHVEVPALPKKVLLQPDVAAEPTIVVRARVKTVRALQLARAGKTNANLQGKEIDNYCKLSAVETEFLEKAMESYRLSARSIHRILKVARTIADLADCESIQKEHLSEALSYRRMR